MESALEEDKDNIAPDDESCSSSSESGDEKEKGQVEMEMEEQEMNMQPESSQDEEQRGRIGQWISTTTTTTTATIDGSVVDRLTPPPTPILPPRLQVDTRMTGLSRTPLFSIPEHKEEEEEESDGDDGVSGEMAALSITSASDSNAFEMLGSPLPIDICLSADGVADRLQLMRVDADLVDCGDEKEKEEDEEDELMQANTNKQRKPFRDPLPEKKGVKRSSNEQPIAGGEAGTASLSTQEIRRKVATTFRRRASGRSGGSSGGKGKNQSKSSASRNQRETIKASTASFWS